MSPQFQRVHLLSHWPINYRPVSLTPILSKVFECLVSVRLVRLIECRGVLPTTQFAYRKGLVTCDVLLWPYRVLEDEAGGEHGSDRLQCRFWYGQPSGDSLQAALWELEVLCCLFCHSLSLIGHSISWWMVVGANWLMSCQECLWEVLWVRSCSSCTPRSFSL